MRISEFQAHILAERACACPPAPLTNDAVAWLLSQNRSRELQLARGSRACRDLTPEQIEDIYQDTVLALLCRKHRDEEHLTAALRLGIKQRALKHHRDQRRRLEILQQHAPGIERDAQARAADSSPENQAIFGEQRQVVRMFLGELSGPERRVFCARAVHGLGYRSAARLLGIDVLTARRLARAVEKKRRLHQL